MPILLRELKLYGSAVMPDTDTPTAIGGAIDTTKRVSFTDVNGTIQCISDAAGDTTQTVTVTYRDSAGIKQSEVKTLNGLTVVLFVATMERLLKALKSATTTGRIAVEAQTAERTGTLQAGGSADSATLDAGASAVDDFFRGMILRVTGGTGSGQIREIIVYAGATKIATVNEAWAVIPDATSTFRVSKGFFFDKNPSEVLEVRRPFFEAAANGVGGAAKTYFEKVFFKNTTPSLALTSAAVKKQADPSGFNDFGLAATLNDTGTNGANNRQVAPSGITFDSLDKNVATGSLTFGDTQGVWLRLSLAAGAAAQKTSVTMRLVGNTV